MRFALVLLAVLPTSVFAADRIVTFSSPMYFLPPVKEIVFTKAGTPAPGDSKHEPLYAVPDLTNKLKTAEEGPYDIWFVPKDGKAIKAIAGFKVKEGTNEIKLNDHLGVISFRGTDQPRGSLIVTAYDDEGPETKKHVVIQAAGDTRAEMAVAPGDYAIWVVPQSGARARRVVDKIRVLAGKTATAD
ncbi:MAG TPA: hypothetical protein VHR66_13480 [Gemmataceae bacterium]|jgi:hypothetical protein|nr:hypothetical protein [Gemmataceae bacterium]